MPGLPPFLPLSWRGCVLFPSEFWAKQMNVLCRSLWATLSKWTVRWMTSASTVGFTLGKEETSQLPRTYNNTHSPSRDHVIAGIGLCRAGAASRRRPASRGREARV